MSLQKKIFLFLSILFLLVIVTIYSIANLILRQEFSLLEKQLAQKESMRTKTGIDGLVEQVAILAADYAGWDDTYRFIQDKNQNYINTNLVDETFNSAKLDYVLILDKSGDLVFGKGFDFHKKQDITLPTDLIAIKNINTQILAQNNPVQGEKGLLKFNNENILVAAYPIVTSEKKGPLLGTLVMARRLDSADLQSISQITGLRLSFRDPVGDEKTSPPNTIFTDEADQDTNKSRVVLTDINNIPVLTAEVVTERDITKQLAHAVSYLLIAVLIFAVVALAVGFIFMRAILLKPLNRIISDVRKISKSGTFSSRVQSSGNGEISSLANEVNSMLESLEQSGQTLMQVNEQLKKQRDSIEKEIDNRTHLLKQEQARFIAAIDSFPDAFIITDESGKIILTNNKLNQTLHDEKETWTIQDLATKFDNVFDIARNVALSQKEKKSLLLSGVAFKKRFLKIYIAPIILGDEDKIIGAVVIIGDITEAVLTERSKDEFLSIASHELRTPLTAIKGNSEMIQTYYSKQLSDKDLSEMVSDIHQASISLIDIVNTFLTTSMLEQGRIEFKMDSIEMVSVVSQTVNKYKKMAQAKNIELSVTNLTQGTIPMQGDSRRLEEVVTNLLSNAIKYTANGTIQVMIDKIDGDLKISVLDTGVGIPQKQQSLLFKKFQQASTDIYTRDITHGTGLGLYISKQIIEAMGGEIYLEQSIEDKGSIFTFTLPLG